MSKTTLKLGFELNRFLNRLLCLLLIPMLMHGTALAHSHAGTGVEEPSGHAARPHVHLPFGPHHHAGGHAHKHERLADASHALSKPSGLAASGAVMSLAVEHDANAIFFGGHHPLFVPAVTVGNAAGDCELAQSEGLGAMSPHPLASQRLSALPPDRHAGLPIYLQVASLRL